MPQDQLIPDDVLSDHILPSLPVVEIPTPMLTVSGRPQRNYRLPARYEDIPPVRPAPVQTSALPPMAPGSLALP